MIVHIRTAIMSLLVFTIILGLIYPILVTGIGQILFPDKANGSIIQNKNKQPIGSELLGQQFNNPKYFWGRLSATSTAPYNGTASSGSNKGPNNPDLIKAAQDRIHALKQVDPDNSWKIPVDLVTSSGSGLDPHISPAAAEYQAVRVARYRKFNIERVHELIEDHTEPRQLGILGEPVVNVLKLNLALDEEELKSGKGTPQS